MPIEHLPGGSIMVTGAGSIDLFRLVTLKAALSLELKCIRVIRGRTAYSILKRELKLTGSRASVLAQVEALLNTYQANPGSQEVQ